MVTLKCPRAGAPRRPVAEGFIELETVIEAPGGLPLYQARSHAGSPETQTGGGLEGGQI